MEIVVSIAGLASLAAIVVALAVAREKSRDASRYAAAARVSEILAEALDAERTLPDALRAIVPAFADWAAVHIADASGPRRAAVIHRDPAAESLLNDYCTRVSFDPDAPHGPARVIRTGEPDVALHVSDALRSRLPAGGEPLVDRVGWNSWIVVPLKARQQTVGALSLSRGKERRAFRQADVAHAQDIGHRIGLAIENARLYNDARELFEQTITANFVSTPAGRILACNLTFAQMLGLDSPEEVLTRPAAIFYAAAEQREKFLRTIREKGRVSGYESTIRRADGQLVSVVENAVGTFDERGELVRITGFVADRTAQKELEEQLRQAQRLEAVGQLAGGVAHDFNNLLTVIIGCVDLLRGDRSATPDGHDPLDEIENASRRAAALTHQLLAFSRRQVLQPRVLDLNDALRNIHSMLRRVVRENIVLILDLDPALHRLEVDPGQLDQVIINLVVNAGDAIHGSGTISLKTRNVVVEPHRTPPQPWVTPGSYVSLEVSDNGIGMDEATRARVFEPFFTTKPVGKGTGLGLSTVYGIVKQSGGFVWLASSPGRGTTVTVYLPEADAAVPRAQPQVQ